MTLPQIHHEGLTLRPITMRVIEQQPDLDPVWMARRILRVYQPGDALYYWDGPWGVLAGSRGVAVVRHGHVVELFTTVVS